MEFKKSEKIRNILKGVAISVICALAFLLVFSIILTYTNLSEEWIQPTVIVLTAISILIGSSISNYKLKGNAVLNGAIIGALYFCTLYLVSSLVTMNFSLNKEMLITVFACMLFGILGGIIGVNKK